MGVKINSIGKKFRHIHTVQYVVNQHLRNNIDLGHPYYQLVWLIVDQWVSFISLKLNIFRLLAKQNKLFEENV